MTGRHAIGWQTTIADLAIILFLVVSSAQARTGARARPLSPPPVSTAATDIYRATAELSLSAWLAMQPRDDRATATVLVRQGRGARSPALATGLGWLAEIERAGHRGRLIVERGDDEDAAVILAYDGTSGTALAASGQ